MYSRKKSEYVKRFFLASNFFACYKASIAQHNSMKSLTQRTYATWWWKLNRCWIYNLFKKWIFIANFHKFLNQNQEKKKLNFGNLKFKCDFFFISLLRQFSKYNDFFIPCLSLLHLIKNCIRLDKRFCLSFAYTFSSPTVSYASHSKNMCTCSREKEI